MRSRWKILVQAALVAPVLFAVALAVGPKSLRGDEPGRLGRLFRLGGGSTSSPLSVPAERLDPLPAPGVADVGVPPLTPVIPPGPPSTFGAPEPGADAAVSPRILPRPRVSQAATEADPLVTRITLGRSDDGNQFGMFLQVYADGTVIDSEGVHSLGREAIRGIVEAVQSGELFRLRGHCGSPSTDFVELVQVVVYERSFGRLRASSFSFSGNPQGCDHAVQRLQSLLDALQARITRPAAPGMPASAASSPLTAPVPMPVPMTAPTLTPTPTGPPIRLNVEPPAH
jgi:hypothetical protein